MQTFLVISDYFNETLLHYIEGVCGSRQTHFLEESRFAELFLMRFRINENNINENNSDELENEGQQVEETKTYTEDEVRELLQRETDRRVSSALKKQEKDY